MPSPEFGPVKHLIVQPTPFCNLDCTYCYLPGRRDLSQMSDAVVKSIVEKLRDSPFVSEELEVVFHAGEPLAVGVEWFRNALVTFDEGFTRNRAVTYGVQTNGTLLSPAWAKLFTEFAVMLSVSLDGPPEIHDRVRTRRNGAGTHADVLRGLDVLRDHGLPFSLLGVLTAHSLAYADEIYRHFRELGPDQVSFNVEEIEGVHRTSSISSQETLDAFRKFLDRFWCLLSADGFPFEVREFEQAKGLLLHRLCRKEVHNSLVTPFSYLTIGSTGAVTTFAPELLTQSHPQLGTFSIGNILDQSLEELAASPRLSAFLAEIEEGVEGCKAHCDYFEFCKGGSPSNKLAELGRMSGTETWWCKTSIQLPVEAALQRLQSTH